MRSEIIASGTELLLGQITDTNTPFIANQLAILGIDLFYASIVGDNYERFSAVLKQALERSDIVIITGGLGPTKGDITREVISGLLGEKMEVDPALKKHITGHFAKMGIEMPENNLKQATLIPSAEAIPNPLGTAPGWWVKKDGKVIISLPGPPGEMQPMWQKEIQPRLEELGGSAIVSRILKTWGLSESKIDQLVGPFMSMANPTLALYAKPDGIQLRITAKSTEKATALDLIQEREKTLRDILESNIWGVDSDTLEEIVAKRLTGNKLSIATAESITGGLLASSLAGAPESSRFFKGGMILADENTRANLGITADSEEKFNVDTAHRMAVLAKDRFGADIGLAIDAKPPVEGQTTIGQAYISIVFDNSEKKIAQTYNWRQQQLGRRVVTHAIYHLAKALESL